MTDKYILYTNLLKMYLNETDEEKKAEFKYQLMLLDEGFNPVFQGGSNDE